MKAVLKTILALAGPKLAELATSICTAVTCAFQFLLGVQKSKAQKEEDKKKKKHEDKIDDVCDNGSLDDLLDLGDGIWH